MLLSRCKGSFRKKKCDVEIFTDDADGRALGKIKLKRGRGRFVFEIGAGTLDGFRAKGVIKGLNNTIYKFIGKYRLHRTQALLTHLPCGPEMLNWIQPFGEVDHGGGNAFFHNGIDFGNPGGSYFSAADGIVTSVETDTGQGWPGTNYRIKIQINQNMDLDYHFEIGGVAALTEREANILVNVGDQVSAGQHIANLITGNDLNADDVAHVHWGVYENGSADKCPLDYFPSDVSQAFEDLYDSGIEKRPAYRDDLCD